MAEPQTTILVVDNEITAVKRLEALLTPRHYRVLTALTGEEALRQVNRHQPDLILLDVLMPGLDGFEVCRRLKTNAETQLIPVLLMTVLNDMEDRIKGFDAGADDFLTKPVHREELLARIRASLRRKATIERKVYVMHQRVQAATERKSHFLTHISHELRTKLDAIIGFSEVLQEQSSGELNAQQAEYVDYILTSGTDLLMDVNGLLEVAHMEMGEATLRFRPLPLRPVLEACLGLVRGHARAHDVTLSLAVDDAIGDVLGDHTQLKQIIFNLLSIAVKLAPADGHVGINVSQPAQAIQVSVWQTGTGRAPKERQGVLEAFGEPRETMAATTAGAGLGLALTRRFAELHGGMIDVQSLPGQGVTFTLSLPAPERPFHPPPSLA